MNENRSGKQLLNRINQVSFAVDDLLLYLDTHPCDERALMLCRKMVKERKELLEKYAQNEDADSLCGIMKKDFSIR